MKSWVFGSRTGRLRGGGRVEAGGFRGSDIVAGTSGSGGGFKELVSDVEEPW